MSENWQQSEKSIVINDKSLDSTAKHLSCDALLHYKFIIHFDGERIFKIGEHLSKLWGKMADRVIRPVRLKTFVLRHGELVG